MNTQTENKSLDLTTLLAAANVQTETGTAETDTTEAGTQQTVTRKVGPPTGQRTFNFSLPAFFGLMQSLKMEEETAPDGSDEQKTAARRLATLKSFGVIKHPVTTSVPRPQDQIRTLALAELEDAQKENRPINTELLGQLSLIHHKGSYSFSQAADKGLEELTVTTAGIRGYYAALAEKALMELPAIFAAVENFAAQQEEVEENTEEAQPE